MTLEEGHGLNDVSCPHGSRWIWWYPYSHNDAGEWNNVVLCSACDCGAPPSPYKNKYTCSYCDFAIWTKNSKYLQCHCDKSTGEYIRKTQGYVMPTQKSCTHLTIDGVKIYPSGENPLPPDYVFREMFKENAPEWVFHDLSKVVRSKKSSNTHYDEVELEDVNGRTGTFNAEYYGMLKEVYTDMTWYLGCKLETRKVATYLLVGMNETKVVALAGIDTTKESRRGSQ